MGPGKYENIGKSQPVLIMINPSISARTRIIMPCRRRRGGADLTDLGCCRLAAVTLCPKQQSQDRCDRSSGSSPTLLGRATGARDGIVLGYCCGPVSSGCGGMFEGRLCGVGCREPLPDMHIARIHHSTCNLGNDLLVTHSPTTRPRARALRPAPCCPVRDAAPFLLRRAQRRNWSHSTHACVRACVTSWPRCCCAHAGSGRPAGALGRRGVRRRGDALDRAVRLHRWVCQIPLTCWD
jgi:hypothetical protein